MRLLTALALACALMPGLAAAQARVYCAQNGVGSDPLRRANLDGSGVEDLITSGLDYPLGMALGLDACPTGPVSVVAYGCGLNPAGSSTVLAGTPRIDTSFTLGVHKPLGTQAAGSIPLLVLQGAPDPASPCGTPIPEWGRTGQGASAELLLGLATPPVALVGPSWSPGAPAAFALNRPFDSSLVGARFYTQALSST